jgi:hypothetical protein
MYDGSKHAKMSAAGEVRLPFFFACLQMLEIFIGSLPFLCREWAHQSEPKNS